MKLMDVYIALKQLNVPLLQTKDVAAYFNISINHANKLLSRIAKTKQMISIKRGIWIFSEIDPLLLPAFLTDPFPSYISLQTALYYHGMISQIPNIIYAVSLARTYVYRMPMATVSIHHIHPSFFFGYEETNGLLKMATPEKALIDIFYLSPAKSSLFRSLPEIELPEDFKLSTARKIIAAISSIRRRTLVKNRFERFMSKYG